MSYDEWEKKFFIQNGCFPRIGRAYSSYGHQMREKNLRSIEIIKKLIEYPALAFQRWLISEKLGTGTDLLSRNGRKILEEHPLRRL